MITALVSRHGDWALCSIDEVLFLVHGKQSVPIRAIGEDEAMRLLCDRRSLDSVRVADLDALYGHLTLRSERYELLYATLLLIDSDRAENVRSAALQFAIKQAESDQWNWISGVLAGAPFPSSTDLTPFASWSHPLGRALMTLQKQQGQLALVHRAFDALPPSVFTHEKRDAVRAKLVNQGVFGLLAGERSVANAGPFGHSVTRFLNAIGTTAAQSSNNLRLEGKSTFNSDRETESAAELDVWEVRPWRATWMATRWPETLPHLALSGAEPWLEPFKAALMTLSSHQSHKDIKTIFETWRAVREASAFTNALDLISQASDPTRTFDHRIQQSNSTLRALTHVGLRKRPTTSALHQLAASAAHADAQGLVQAVIAFFDLPVEHNRSAELSDLTKGKLARSSAVVAHCLQLELDAGIPLSCERNAQRAQTHTSSSVQNDHLSDAPPIPLRQDFCRMLEVHALERIFEAGGFLLVDIRRRGSRFSVSSASLALINLSRGRYFGLNGLDAMLVSYLGDRLARDQESGIPSERCGWIQITELAQHLSTEEGRIRTALNRVTDYLSTAMEARAALEWKNTATRLKPGAAVAASSHASGGLMSSKFWPWRPSASVQSE